MSAKASRRLRTALVVVLVLAALYGAYRYTLHRMVEAKLNEIRKQGYPVTLAEIDKWYPQPPPGENAAGLYEQAFSHLGDTGDGPLYSFLRWTLRPDAPVPTEIADQLSAYISTNKATSDLLRRIPHHASYRNPAELRIGSKAYQHRIYLLGRCVNLSTFEAILDVQNDRPDMAMDSLGASWNTAGSLGQETDWWAQQVRRTGLGFSVTVLERLLDKYSLRTNDLKRLSEELTDAESPESASYAVVSERCQVTDWILGARSGESLLDVLAAHPQRLDESRPVDLLVPIPGRLFPIYRLSGIIELDLLFYLKTERAYEEVARVPATERFVRLMRVAPNPNLVPKLYVVSYVLLPDPWSDIVAETRTLAWLRAANTGLAVESYRQTLGRLPDKLADLAPIYLNSIPTDPFNGQPLGYRKLAKGYVVYSVGEDGKDDGGDEKKDITFTVER